MATPRKVTQENWYDIFSEWSPSDRAIAIRVLEQTHRSLLKIEKKHPYTVVVETGPTFESVKINEPKQTELTEVIAATDEHPAVSRTPEGKLVVPRKEPDGGRAL